MSSTSFISRFVKKKIGDYKQQVNYGDESLPLKISTPKKVAVIGGGLAGISSAIYLSERNFDVTIFEKESYLGGKIGSWPVSFEDGFTTNVEHGFHAFFRQYYNLKNLLKKIDAHKNLIPIDDYLIMTKEMGSFSFKEIKTTPVENILSMRKSGIYSYANIIANPKFIKMLELVKYEMQKTFEKFDHISFKNFADDVNLQPQMRLMFTTFSRAFFAEPHLISMAELIKSFHFYFLSNDLGLIYDVLNDDFEETLWKPAKDFLSRFKSKINLKTQVESITKLNNKFSINGEEFDYTILASDVKGTKQIIEKSDYLKSQHPTFYNNMLELKQSQRYSVLRIWIDKDVRKDVPFFIFTDALKILDSVTIYHRMEQSSKEWANRNGGGIFELHSYALPDEFPESEVRSQLLREFEVYFPEISGYLIQYEYLQVKNDFTAFHTNLFINRPGVNTEVDNLFLAGDWVKLDQPAMLMEAATTSALYCTNNILSKERLKQEPIFSVPKGGIFA